jgi:hypothetical protein
MLYVTIDREDWATQQRVYAMTILERSERYCTGLLKYLDS